MAYDDNRTGWSNEAPTARVDRRAAVRQPCEIDVTLTSESHFFAGITGDVSRGGVFVQTYEPRAIGSRLSLSFELPTGRVETEGVVRWSRPGTDGTAPGYGVAFERLQPADRLAIEAFCRARPPLYYDGGDDD